jgi:methyl-accepting chemotaxis protein WspA
VNQWTIRTRILASFSLILLVMALMGVVAYTRLNAIERGTAVLLQDALPGLTYSTGIRGVWGERYVLAWQTFHAANAADRRSFQRQNQEAAGRLDKLEQQYETSIMREEDRVAFKNYRDVRAHYEQAAQILLREGEWNAAAAAAALRGEAQDRWVEARKAAQHLVDDNSAISARAARGIDDAVSAARMGIEAALIRPRHLAWRRAAAGRKGAARGAGAGHRPQWLAHRRLRHRQHRRRGAGAPARHAAQPAGGSGRCGPLSGQAQWP